LAETRWEMRLRRRQRRTRTGAKPKAGGPIGKILKSKSATQTHPPRSYLRPWDPIGWPPSSLMNQVPFWRQTARGIPVNEDDLFEEEPVGDEEIVGRPGSACDSA
jgi:hypothetical protein